MTPQAILLDIDGTIVARDGAIDPGLAAVLCAARDAGVRVGCATARTHPSARIRLRGLEWVADEGVFHNGALVVVGGRTAWAAEMPAATVTAAARAARAADPAVVMAIHHASAAPAFSAEFTDELLAAWGVTAAQVRTFAAGLASPAIKLGMWMPGERPGSIRAVHAAVAAAVGPQATVFEADEGRFVFMTAPGIDKAAGAREWFAAHSLDPAHAVAAGDDRTDAPLLELCGHGIAIMGGHAQAQAVADEVVDAPPGGGLARALRLVVAQRGDPA